MAALVHALGGGEASAAAPANKDPQYAAAIAAARAGQVEQALPLIEQRYRRDPSDLSTAYDYLVVLGWAHRPADAIAIYEHLPPGRRPDFVEQAVARDYRDLGDFDRALALYRAGKHAHPTETAFVAGEILTLADSGKAAEAVVEGDALARHDPDNVELLSATTYAALAAGRGAQTLAYARRVLALDPGDRDARRAEILALARLGSTEAAAAEASRFPSVLTPEELRRINGDAAASIVREAGVRSQPDEDRWLTADRAIAKLDAQIAALPAYGAAARSDLLRARFDRVLALGERDRTDDVIAAYEGFQGEGIPVPPYVLKVAGDAYMRRREPEKARTAYEAARAQSPGDFDIELGLFYAEVESEDFTAAFATIDALADAEAPTVIEGGRSRPNPLWTQAQLVAARARFYAGDAPEAQRRVEKMLEIDPRNAALLSALASLKEAQDRPQAAQALDQQAKAVEPDNRDAAVGKANAALDRGDRTAASADIDDLIASAAAEDHETSIEVKRLESRYDTLAGPELTLSVNQLFQTTQAPLGGDTFTLAARMYSGMIDETYRIFADYRLATVILPEGRETDHHTGVGVEFTGQDIGASAELTEDVYPRPHIGGKATVSWAPDDSWRLAADAQIFSDDTPLRALKHDITADSASLRATYRVSDLQTYTLTGELLTFSDGNFRASVDLSSRQRLFTTPTITFDVIPELYTSNNTRTNEPYYNPARDFEGAIGLDATQILYRRYDFVYLHHLAFVPGYYWEQGFSGRPAYTLVYEQRLRLSDDWSGALGVRLARHPYDGTQEDSVAVFASMDWRF